MTGKEKKAGDILYRYLEKTCSKIGQTYSEMFRSWDHIAGDKLKDHSRIKEFHKGTVIIEVDHPAYFQLIQMEKNRILKNLKKKYKELNISKIRILLAERQQSAALSGSKNIGAENEKMDRKEFDALMKRLREAVSEKENR